MAVTDPEKLRECLGELEGRVVIVEGRKDSNALKTLGVKNIIPLNGKPLAEFAFHVSKSLVTDIHHTEDRTQGKPEVVILTDFDSAGREIAEKLDYLLRKHRAIVNNRIRRKFMKFGKNRIEDFKEGDVYGKVSSDFNKVHHNRADKGKRCGGKT